MAYKTIKIFEKTHAKIMKLQGEKQRQIGKRVTADQILNDLINQTHASEKKEKNVLGGANRRGSPLPPSYEADSQ